LEANGSLSSGAVSVVVCASLGGIEIVAARAGGYPSPEVALGQLLADLT
jgi:hypothetical protein